LSERTQWKTERVQWRTKRKKQSPEHEK